MPVYADVDDLDVWEEIAARIKGRLTFVRIGLYLAMREADNAHHVGLVLAEHAHHAGVDELERPCQTVTRKKVTDLSPPPF